MDGCVSRTHQFIPPTEILQEPVLMRRCIARFTKVQLYTMSYKSAADKHSRSRNVHVNSCKLTAISDFHMVSVRTSEVYVFSLLLKMPIFSVVVQHMIRYLILMEIPYQ
jgi:hypothetical protein